MENLYSKIVALCEDKKISLAQMAKESGISKNILTELKMGRTKTLSMRSLNKIADYFSVSVDFLTGNSEQKEKAPIVSDEDLRLAEFNKLFTSLPPDVQARELAYLRELANNSNK